MSCNCKHKHIRAQYADPSCMEPTPWNETEHLVGLDKCGHIIKTEKPEYELDELDREKLDALEIDADGNKALYDDGIYKETYTVGQVYTREQTDAAITEAVDTLDGEISANYLKLSGNSEQTPVTGDIYIDSRIVSRQFSSEGSQWRTVIDGTDYGTVKLGSPQAQTEIRSSARPSVNSEEYVAYLSDVQGVSDDVDRLQTDVNALATELSDTADRVTQAEERIDHNTTSIADLSEATTAAFNTVNETLTEQADRITQNTADIDTNKSDIASIRTELNEQDHFRGYHETTAEITAIPNPKDGDYAYNAETGTKWLYNGTTWLDSNVPVPDQTVDAYDGTPLMDGEGDPGTSNRYARGDHRHPSDDSKADVTVLNDYLPLVGNTQATRMTGDVWVSSGQRVRLTNSGNSNIGHNPDTNTTEVVGNGVGGVDILAPNGTVKANGEEVVSYTAGNEIDAKGDILLQNDRNLFGVEPDGSVHNLIQLSRYGIVDVGSTTTPMTLNSEGRPNVQLTGETGAQAHDIAFLSDVTDTAAGLQSQINTNLSAIERNASAIAVNASDIESIQSELADQNHFRGYYATTNEVTAIENPKAGDYAFNAQTGTKWIYNGTTWADSGEDVPDQTVEAYSGLPLIDGQPSAGEVNQYSRGDHRHPTDITRASVSDLTDLRQTAEGIRNDLDGYISETDSELNTLSGNVSNNTSLISGLTTRVNNAEAGIDTLNERAEQYGTLITGLQTDVADLDDRVTITESDIESLQSQVTNNENFKGFFLTTVEVTQLPGTPGDFAWNGETGTVWIYDGSVPSWTDSQVPIPSGSVTASEALPLIDGIAEAGQSNQYARGDHRHPTDETRAGVAELAAAVNQIESLDARVDSVETELSGFVSRDELDEEIEDFHNILESEIESVADLVSRNYLPLTGGTLTGDLTVDAAAYVNTPPDTASLTSTQVPTVGWVNTKIAENYSITLSGDTMEFLSIFNEENPGELVDFMGTEFLESVSEELIELAKYFNTTDQLPVVKIKLSGLDEEGHRQSVFADMTATIREFDNVIGVFLTFVSGFFDVIVGLWMISVSVDKTTWTITEAKAARIG